MRYAAETLAGAADAIQSIEAPRIASARDEDRAPGAFKIDLQAFD